MRHPDIEFMFAQHPWLENDCLMADIILPVNTKLEEDDSAGDIFSGQAVFEPDVDQCTEDAKVTVVKVGNGKVHEATTDSYGDFWLRDVKPGEYPILVEKDAYLPQKMGPVDASKDIDVGDIAGRSPHYRLDCFPSGP